MVRWLLAVPAALVVLVAPPAASAQVVLGVLGDAGRFAAQTGQDSQIHHTFMSFDQGDHLPQIVATMGPIPLLALNAGAYGAHESATPQGLALGQNDTFLFQLNAQIDAWAGDTFYVRPFPEMNGHWESTCAYNQNGTKRDAAHSTMWNRKALARIAVVLRGGAQAQIDAKLAKLGLPGIDRDLPVTTPKLRIVWNPQGFGSPDVPGNSAQAYYPGDAYVDVIGDDLYDIRGHGATWAAADSLYKAHPSKPFAFPEWGLWGVDDPTFVHDMATWLVAHKRVEFASYYSGRPGSVWDLASKPASRVCLPRGDHAPRMITWDDVLALGRELPETEESTSYGRPSLKVRGKSFVTLRERPDALVVRCDGEEKPFLLEGRPDIVFTTPHYDGYPYLLVRLDAPPEEARELVLESWLLVAPKKLAAQVADKL